MLIAMSNLPSIMVATPCAAHFKADTRGSFCHESGLIAAIPVLNFSFLNWKLNWALSYFRIGSYSVGLMNLSFFSVPVEDRYLEDYQTGAVYEFGTIRATEADIIEFGKRFDPQVFHTSPKAAQLTSYGGLIASGWHTAGMMMRLFVDHYLSHAASLGSPGVDELRWTQPVRPGDALTMRVTVTATRRSVSKPDRGVLLSFIEMLNQNQEVVMSMKAVNLLLCREKV
jgi:acyl dehydratase